MADGGQAIPPFAGWRIVELSSSIAASYCGKMFADAGADVVKIEPPHGDPMRRWSAGGTPGALFGYLAAAKSSVLRGDEEATALIAGADLVLTDLSDGWSLDDLTACVGQSAVIAAITPFGTTGPYVDEQILANEFILQALCGSIASRGWPGSEPLQAGGRIGEWLAGTFAAVVAAAAVRHARNGGDGAVIDVSIYESMVVAMGSLSAMSASVLGGDSLLTQRSLELPSIVPTADGMIGFCTITAQQFQDFLVLIDRPDLLADDDLASMPGRVRRRDEFLAMVQRWTETRTTEEILEHAVALRIPVAPIGSPASVMKVDHFVERGVFAESTRGVFQPRVPYRSSAMATRAAGSAPEVGEHAGRVHWAAGRRTGARPIVRPAASRNQGRRLHRLLGRPGSHPGAGVVGGRSDKDRRCPTARWHAPRWWQATHLGAVVGVGPGFPVQQHEQARRQHRTWRAAGPCTRA